MSTYVDVHICRDMYIICELLQCVTVQKASLTTTKQEDGHWEEMKDELKLKCLEYICIYGDVLGLEELINFPTYQLSNGLFTRNEFFKIEKCLAGQLN